MNNKDYILVTQAIDDWLDLRTVSSHEFDIMDGRTCTIMTKYGPYEFKYGHQDYKPGDVYCIEGELTDPILRVNALSMRLRGTITEYTGMHNLIVPLESMKVEDTILKCIEYLQELYMPFEISKIMTFSTGHISERDNTLLTLGETKLSVGIRDPGYFIYCKHDIEMYDDLSPAFNDLIRIARKHGCDFICLDYDGPTFSELEVFKW